MNANNFPSLAAAVVVTSLAHPAGVRWVSESPTEKAKAARDAPAHTSSPRQGN